MSFKFNNVKLSKWQLAVIMGAPIALGISCYIYKKYSGKQSETKLQKSKDPHVISLPPKKQQKDLSIDGTSEDDKEVDKKSVEFGYTGFTPLEEATMYKNEGNTCYRNGKFDEAIIFYDKAIEKCPKNNTTDLAIFYQNRAAAFEMLRKWSKVKEDCTKSLECNPRYVKAYFRRAKAYEAMNNIKDCLDDITATCILEGFQNSNSIMYADRILKQSGCDDAKEGMLEKVPSLPSKNFIGIYFRSFMSDPLQDTMILSDNVYKDNDKQRGFCRAKQALDKQRYDEIIPACTEEIESSESESQYKNEALLLRGTFHLLCGSFTEAHQDLNAVINNVDADNALRGYALLRRASVLIQLDQKDEAFKDFEQVQQLLPENPDLYHQRAQIYMLLDLLPKALEDFEKAIKYAPNNAMAFVQKCYAEYRYGLILGDQMRLLMIMNEFRNAIEKFPKCVECYSLMAQVLSDQQQYSQADDFYEKAIKIAPDNASLLVHRGIMMLQWKGDVKEAVDLIEKAIVIDDKCELAYETLGTIEVQRANLERAVELFETAIQLVKSRIEMCHLYALRNAAIAQINVTQKLGIDVATLSALSQSAYNTYVPS